METAIANYQINQVYWHESKFNDTEIVQTILDQLNTGGRILWCWGASKFISLGDALKFSVNGAKFKGQVLIIYDKDEDLYNILFGKITKDGWILKEFYEGVYCDNLVDLIDEYVET